MRSGKLNSRITFFTTSQVGDGYGGSNHTKVDLLETNANVKPLSQDRTLQANQSDLIGGYNITVRYRRDFTPTKTMFIRYGSSELTITSIQQSDEDRQMYNIIALIKK